MKNKINKHMDDTGLYNVVRKITKYSFLLIVLTASLFVTSASLLEKTNTSPNIESITSISNITDSNYYSLAKTAKIDALQVVFSGMWSPDGSRLLISSGSHLPGTAGLTAVYVMNADGTEIKEIASTLNNTGNKSLNKPSQNSKQLYKLSKFYPICENYNQISSNNFPIETIAVTIV